ncbi:MAG: hypothetical protein MZV63_47630 [Marinilabiliales bacterium]|nr:hypothetical protein [Marinilabiliales bacterium]
MLQCWPWLPIFIRKDKQVVVVDPWVAVPSDAFFMIETNDFPELLTRTTDPDRYGVEALWHEMGCLAYTVCRGS